ncbi:MAG: FkbM family methyltransferase [Patescibacteria group bacterium]
MVLGVMRGLIRIVPSLPNRVLRLAFRLARSGGSRFFVFEDTIALIGSLPRLAVKSKLGFWYCGNIGDSADIAYGVLSGGVVEPGSTYLVKYIMETLGKKKSKMSFYDIGANTGYFGVLAAYLGRGNVTSYAFEPVREFNMIQQETIKLNRLEKNLSVFGVAVGEKDCTVDVYLAGSGTTLKKEFLGNPETEARKVEMVALDDFAKQQGLKPPDFLKIDVEGYEFQVLLGARSILTKTKPVIFYESALTMRERGFRNEFYLETQELLWKVGYEIFIPGERELEVVGRDFKPKDGVDMYLALHSEKHADLRTDLYRAYPVLFRNAGQI